MTINPEGDSPNNIDELASEYVLGTLPAEQRIKIQKRLAQEADLRTAVDAWEQRLLPLTEVAEPLPPTPLLWGRIERSLNSNDRRASGVAATAKPASWWNLLPLWRGLAGVGLVATLLLGSVLLTRTAPVNPTTYLVVWWHRRIRRPAGLFRRATQGKSN